MGTDELDQALADPQLAAYVREQRANPPASVAETGVTAARQAFRDRVAAMPPGPELTAVSDLDLPGPDGTALPARLYRRADGPLPVIVYFHGGGWTIGDLDTHDAVCRRLADATGACVLAVDFRRAPEHPFPAAVDDAVAAVRAAQRMVDAGEATVLAVAGDSAGGYLATMACLRLRDAGERLPVAQFLAYPNTDLTLSQPSTREKVSGWGLSTEAAAWFGAQFESDPDLRADGSVSPLFAGDLSGLPPAVVVTCEHDPLRDEGEAYAARLDAAGVAVRTWRERGLIHGFLLQGHFSSGAKSAEARFFAAARAAVGRLARAS